MSSFFLLVSCYAFHTSFYENSVFLHKKIFNHGKHHHRFIYEIFFFFKHTCSSYLLYYKTTRWKINIFANKLNIIFFVFLVYKGRPSEESILYIWSQRWKSPGPYWLLSVASSLFLGKLPNQLLKCYFFIKHRSSYPKVREAMPLGWLTPTLPFLIGHQWYYNSVPVLGDNDLSSLRTAWLFWKKTTKCPTFFFFFFVLFTM